MKAATLKDLSWVMVQLALMAALLMTPAVGNLPFLVPLHLTGLVIAAAGLMLAGVATWQLQAGRSLTPMPSPRAGATLQIKGLYRHVRHPVYSGLLLWALGMAIAVASILHFVLLALLGVFFSAKAKHEERMLIQKFRGYAGYAKHTPPFIPRPYHLSKP
ncbi:MAG: isoprenylcysteine carboxylmethyltransferase family protein [Prosthecobacter sp.]|nr:isoprenylcysteine carboxylmethyltransferase family protein [Prosthecobacter sp.]